MTMDNGLAERLKFLQIDERSRRALGDVKSLLQEKLPSILDAFYAHLGDWKQVYEMFGGKSHIAHVQERPVPALGEHSRGPI